MPTANAHRVTPNTTTPEILPAKTNTLTAGMKFVQLIGSPVRWVTPKAIDAFDGSTSNMRIYLDDGTIVSLRRSSPGELIECLAPYLKSPIVAVQGRPGMGSCVYIVADAIRGYSTANGGLWIHLRSPSPLTLPGATVADLEAALARVYGPSEVIDPVRPPVPERGYGVVDQSPRDLITANLPMAR